MLLPRCSKLAAVSQALTKLDPALAAAVAPPPSGSSDPATEFAFSQACVSFKAVGACAQMAAASQLDSSDAFRVAAGARIIFNAGTAALRLRLWHARRQATQAELAMLADTSHDILLAAESCLGLLTDTPAALAAFASTAAQPGVAVPWLAAVSEALLTIPLESNPGEMERQPAALHML